MAMAKRNAKCRAWSPSSKCRRMVAKTAAASGGRSSPSHRPATPRTSTLRTALTSMRSSWIARLESNRDARTPTAMAAKTMPTPIRASSCWAAAGGRWASQRRKASAPMMAAAPIPLIRARRQDRRVSAPAQAPGIRLNGLPAGLPAEGLPSAATYRHAQSGRTFTLTTSNDNVRDTNLLRSGQQSLNGPVAAGGALLGRVGLGALGDRTLERRSPGGMKRKRLVGLAVRDAPVGPAGGRVLRAQLGQAFLLGRQGGLEGVGKLGVVHGDDPEASLQLDHLHLSPCQLEIDRFCHFLPLIRYGATTLLRYYPEITTQSAPRLCLEPGSWLRSESLPALDPDRDGHVGGGAVSVCRAEELVAQAKRPDGPIASNEARRYVDNYVAAADRSVGAGRRLGGRDRPALSLIGRRIGGVIRGQSHELHGIATIATADGERGCAAGAVVAVTRSATRKGNVLVHPEGRRDRSSCAETVGDLDREFQIAARSREGTG